MMIDNLSEKQKFLWENIKNTAITTGLTDDYVEPIYDGAFNPELYSASSPRVMWVLKEPYDDLKDGKPYGGGWGIDCCIDGEYGLHEHPKRMTRSYRKIIYSLYGLYYDVELRNMPYARDIISVDSKAHRDTLERCALINISKMPGFTRSYDNYVIGNFRRYWKETVTEQMEIYDPEIIICGGRSPIEAISEIYGKNLVQVSRYDGDLRKSCYSDESHFYDLFRSYLDGFVAGDRIVLSAYHPGCIISEDLYVNSIRETVKGISEKYLMH